MGRRLMGRHRAAPPRIVLEEVQFSSFPPRRILLWLSRVSFHCFTVGGRQQLCIYYRRWVSSAHTAHYNNKRRRLLRSCLPLALLRTRAFFFLGSYRGCKAFWEPQPYTLAVCVCMRMLQLNIMIAGAHISTYTDEEMYTRLNCQSFITSAIWPKEK
jgi:hypothetical protein